MSVKTLLWARGELAPISAICENTTHYICTDGFRLHAMVKTESLPKTIPVVSFDEFNEKAPISRLLKEQERVGLVDYSKLFSIINFLERYNKNLITFSTSKTNILIASTRLSSQSFAIISVPLQLETSTSFCVSYNSKLILQAIKHVKTKDLVDISLVITDKVIIKFSNGKDFSLVAPLANI